MNRLSASASSSRAGLVSWSTHASSSGTRIARPSSLPRGTAVRSFSASSRSQWSFRDLTQQAAASGKSLAARLRDSARSTMFGDSPELEKLRLRGGLTPEEQRQYLERARRERAVAAVDSEGNPLLDDAEETPEAIRARRVTAHVAAKAQKRQERKRYGSKLLAEPEHKYSTRDFKISPQKLQVLSHQIIGKPIDYAILQMQFSDKRAARRIKSMLCLARDHAISSKGMDRSRLIVKEAWVGKGTTHKRVEIKGRGRTGVRKTFFSRMEVLLKHGKTKEEQMAEMVQRARKLARSVGTGGVHRTNATQGTFTRTSWGY